MWVDNGQHVFLRACVAYRRFLARIGSDRLTDLQTRLSVPVIGPGGKTAWLRRARLPAPLQLGPSLARYSHLGVRDRLRVASAALRLAWLDPSLGDLDRQTLTQWLTAQRQSPCAVQRFWNLIALPTLNVHAHEASMALATTMFRTGFFTDATAADIGYSRVPLDRLHADPAGRALVEAGVEVLLRHRARRVVLTTPAARAGGTDDGGVAGVTVDGGHIDADAVILAVPHEDAASLLPGAARVDVAGLRQLGKSPIVNIHVVYDRRVTGLMFAAGVGTPVQFVFDRTAASGLGATAPRDGSQYLAVSLSGADDYISVSTEELYPLFTSALASLFPRARAARVERFFVTREPAATFRGVAGTARLRPGTRTGVERLFLSGAWTDTGWPATMEGAARSGEAAASEALMAVGRRRSGEGVAA
jgi:squalene-associated FAD-dependent desaturase